MSWLIICLQCSIALAMLDVWLIRYNSPGFSRGGSAKTMAEEFKVYNLPDWFRDLIRFLKLSLGFLMLVGIWWPFSAFTASTGLAVLLVGAMVMHLKVKDPFYKLLPSSFFGSICVIICIYHWPA